MCKEDPQPLSSNPEREGRRELQRGLVEVGQDPGVDGLKPAY